MKKAKKQKSLKQSSKAASKKIKEKAKKRLANYKKNQRLKRNHKSIGIYENCDELPAYRFDALIRTGDRRWLLKSDKVVDYDVQLLAGTYNNICNEYDSLTNRDEFRLDTEEKIEHALKISRLQGLRACFNLLRLGDQRAIEELKVWDVNIESITLDSIHKVRSIIAREQMELNIDIMEEASARENTKEDKYSFVKSAVLASRNLNYRIDHKKITVTEWVQTQSILKEMAAEARNNNR